MNRKELIAFKIRLPRYLSELSSLFGRTVTHDELLSLPETTALQEQSRLSKREPEWSVEVPFSERLGGRFVALLRALSDLNPSPVYVWIEGVQVCGVPRPVPLADLHFDFGFSDVSGEIVSISTSDLADRMVLDLSKDEIGREMLQIEVSGPRWSAVKY